MKGLIIVLVCGLAIFGLSAVYVLYTQRPEAVEKQSLSAASLRQDYVCQSADGQRFIHIANNGVVAEVINGSLIQAGNIQGSILSVATPEQYFKLNYDSCMSLAGKTLFDDYSVQFGTSGTIKILRLTDIES